MFFTRLISGIVLVLGLIILFVLGDPYLTIAFGLLSLCGVYELLRVFGLHKDIIGLWAMTASAVYYVLIGLRMTMMTMFLLVVSLIVLMIIYVLRYPKVRIEAVAQAYLSGIYVAGLLSYVVLTRNLRQGEWLVWLIVMGSWGADTCAYCVGKLIGKHHFSELSPKKTIEGCIGGVLGAALIAFIYSFFVPEIIGFSLHPNIAFPIVAAVGAVVSIFGDLTASAIKRNYDIKDYGRIIPGHGGILDRFDSVIFVAPFVFYLLVFM